MSGIPKEDWYSWQAPDMVAPYGMALVTCGLCVGYAVNPIGLLSFGFLWQLCDIWFNENFYSGISTSWASDFVAENITTVWVSDFVSEGITTTWTRDPNNSTGSYPP